MYGGWVQVASAPELAGEVNPVQVGSLPLVVLCSGGDYRTGHATCPHRGANLGYGGVLDGDAVVCPFHHRRVHVGLAADQPWCVPAYPTMAVGEAVFALLDPAHDHGFTDFMAGVAATRYLVAGPVLPIRVAPELVVENVFDADHFQAVHGLHHRPELHCREGEHGELLVEGTFRSDRPNRWQAGAGTGGDTQAHFRARVFSPYVVAAELGDPELPNVVVTAATPAPGGGSVVRVLVGMARTTGGQPSTVAAIASLMNGTVTAFEQDRTIWEHLDPAAPARLTAGDELVVAYRRWCEGFAAAGTGAGPAAGVPPDGTAGRHPAPAAGGHRP